MVFGKKKKGKRIHNPKTHKYYQLGPDGKIKGKWSNKGRKKKKFGLF
ncbi:MULTISPECIES: hypothetical protein [unclassified Thermococcus]|nr:MULTISPECIES: hypothetical protein [unclassified Thermococcus]